MNFKQCLIILTFVAVINCESVPVITKCKTTDSKCITASGNALIQDVALGVEKYGIKPLDPFYIKYIDLSSPNLKLTTTDAVISGLKNSVLQSVKIDKVKSKMVVKIRCNIQLEGQYDMSGKLLFIPLEGKGQVHVTIRDMDVVINTDFKEVTASDGKIHWQIIYRDYKYALKNKSTVIFDNLFNEQEVVAQAAKQVIEESGNEIIEEVGSPLITGVVEGVVKEIGNLFEAVPASDLALD